MSGMSELRRALRASYRPREMIGVTVCELVSVEPVTLRVEYNGIQLDYSDFMSLIGFEGVDYEDIGKKYAAILTNNNQVPYVLGEFKEYNKFFPIPAAIKID